jgi:hypothetical protein
LQKIALADILGDIEGLGIEFSKDDFVDRAKTKKGGVAEEIIQENKYLKDYLE